MPEPTLAEIRASERERLHDEATNFVRTCLETWDEPPTEADVLGAIEKVYRVLCDCSPTLRSLRRRRAA